MTNLIPFLTSLPSLTIDNVLYGLGLVFILICSWTDLVSSSPIGTISRSVVSLISYGLLCLIALFINIVQILSALLIAPFHYPTFFSINTFLNGTIWELLQCTFKYISRPRFIIEPSSLSAFQKDESALIISNHASSLDFLSIHEIAQQLNMLPYCKYFSKELFKYIPIFGWAMKWTHTMIFLKRDRIQDLRKIEETLNFYSESFYPAWIVLFPEGTRRNQKTLSSSNKFAKGIGKVEWQHVLHPRPYGFNKCVEVLRQTRRFALYDVTIAYFHERKGWDVRPSILETLLGHLDEYEIFINVKRYDMSDIPNGDAVKWLNDRFQDKETDLKNRFSKGLSSRTK